MKVLKKGDRGREVQSLQQKLMLKPDGIFGSITEKHVIRYQLMYNMPADGICGSEMWSLILQQPDKLTEEIDEDNDTKSQFFKTNYGQYIHKHYLPKGEYIDGPVNNEYIFIHHTAGNSNPYRCIDHWGRDTRGRVATEFVLGGINHRNGNDENDGVMVQAFPKGAQGWHLGKTGSGYMNRHSVGLEVCNMAYLSGSKNKTYVGSICQPDQVITLEEPFKGHINWHAYTHKQINAIEKWIKFVGERDEIDVRIGLKQFIQKHGPTKGFGFNEDAFYGNVKGLLTHTNVRKDKSDMYPHPDLVDMILSL
tara:strand:- start:5720 stop:6643 length:924 start_codon:yes stop_codon:yes gene_type:complete